MGYSKEVVEKVKKEYEDKRQNAVNTAEVRKAEMYEICPMIKDIDAALSMTGLKIYKAALEGKNGLEERIKDLEKENLDLQDNKRRLLKLSGKTEDYLDIKYSCKKCNDTGYVGINMCACMKKALVKEAYNSSGLGAVLTKQGFDNFDISLYSDVKNKNGISPRENMAYVLSEAKDYVKNFGKLDKPQNLLFTGKTGLGKTHISTAVAKGVIDKGYDVVYDTMQNIMHVYEMQTFSHNAEAGAAALRYEECSLLIIDDLGTEMKSSFTQSVLYNIINSRIISGKAMIISTNINEISDFKKQYDDRICSRLIGNFRPFNFFGDDIRLKLVKMNGRK